MYVICSMDNSIIKDNLSKMFISEIYVKLLAFALIGTQEAGLSFKKAGGSCCRDCLSAISVAMAENFCLKPYLHKTLPSHCIFCIQYAKDGFYKK